MTKDKRIGFYCSSISWGGLEMNMVRHARWMSELGWDVTIFCCNGSSIHQECSDMTVELIERNKKYFDHKNARVLSRLFKRLQIELVWIRDGRDFCTIGLAKTKSKGAFKVLYQQAMELGVDKKDIFHTKRFSKIDLWVSPLKFLAEQVLNRTKFPEDKIRIIPLGIDVERILSGKIDKLKAREGLNLSNDRFTLGIIGRIDPKKGQLFLVNAVAELIKGGYEIDLLIVGDKTKGEAGEYYQEIIELIEKEKLADHVYMKPFTKNVAEVYSALDCFVMASEAETFGMVTLEAMLFGLPVIGTNTGGTPNLLGNGEFGLLFNPGDEIGFSKNLKKLIMDNAYCASIGDAASVSVVKRFDKNEVCALLEKEIIKLL